MFSSEMYVETKESRDSKQSAITLYSSSRLYIKGVSRSFMMPITQSCITWALQFGDKPFSAEDKRER